LAKLQNYSSLAKSQPYVSHRATHIASDFSQNYVHLQSNFNIQKIMKKAIFIIISILLLFACGNIQNTDDRFNLDFEKIENGFPTGWKTRGDTLNCIISIDSIIAKTGNYSTVIESNGNLPISKILFFTLPENYDGKQITLSGYIKTENEMDSYAGLYMIINPFIAFDNMQSNSIKGTTDWTKYEITLNMYPSCTENVNVGGYLIGKGKVWFDDFKVTIDGKDIQKLKPYKKKPFPAEKDKKFDNGSNIVFSELDDQKISDLELLGKIWGFLKYHHPKVGQGKYNWDYELFRMLPSYLKVNDNGKRDRILLKWIKKYGTVSSCKTCQTTPEDAFIKPDLSWIEISNMNPKLKSVLQGIYSNRYQGNHYYIRMAAGIGNPIFSNENAYAEMPYPDAGFRLLALYRYWNMIHYFNPTKYLTDKDWNNLLKEYIPLFVNANNELNYELTTTQIIGEVCDSHAGLWGDKMDLFRGNMTAPFRVQFIENQLVVMEYYSPNLKNPNGPEIGDIITHINGKPVEVIVDSIKKYYPASNEAGRMRGIAPDLLRSDNSAIHISFISSGQIKQKDIPLYERSRFYMYKKDNVKCYKLLDGNIGYITLESIKDEDVADIKKIFKNTRGIIIDIRCYPSANVLYSLGSYFVSSPTPFVKFTKGNSNNPGEFTFSPGDEIPESTEHYQGKLIVIVNETTQSAAEFEAMAFKAGDNTTVIGSQTAGADGNVSEIVLPGGLKTWISGIGIYYPDGRETQRIGIVPDIEVKPTIKGIREGRDEVLEKAIEIIKQEQKPKKAK
jgi:C-terminal processing protease CtpA/Prc